MRFLIARFSFAAICVTCLISVGCEQPVAPPAVESTPPAVSATETPAGTAQDLAPAAAGPELTTPSTSAPTTTAAVPPAGPVPEGFTPVPVEGEIVKLTPENTTIQVIGRHAAPRGGPNDPMARTIVFMKFEGQLEIDGTAKLPKSAKAEIDATSLTAFAGNLTSHLKNPDFIDVEKFPTIKFVSTKIEPTKEPGQVNIVGNLTLKDVTKEISIPAKVTRDASGMTLLGEVQLNRRDFNINAQAIDSSTMPEIDFTIAVGKKSAAPSGGGPRRGG